MQPVTVKVTGTPSLWRRSSCWFVWTPTTVKTIGQDGERGQHDAERHLTDTPAVHRTPAPRSCPTRLGGLAVRRRFRAREVRWSVITIGRIVVGSAARLAARPFGRFGAA